MATTSDAAFLYFPRRPGRQKDIADARCGLCADGAPDLGTAARRADGRLLLFRRPARKLRRPVAGRSWIHVPGFPRIRQRSGRSPLTPVELPEIVECRRGHKILVLERDLQEAFDLGAGEILLRRRP